MASCARRRRPRRDAGVTQRRLASPALALMLALAPGGARAQAAAGAPRVRATAPAGLAPWTPPARFADRVRSDVASRWHLDPDRVRLEWGPAPTVHPPTDSSAASLLGTGAGGAWIVDVDGGRGRLSLRAGTLVQRAVARRALNRGETLATGDIALDTVLAWGEPGAEPTSAVQAGWVANRPLRAGEPLRPPAVSAPAVVRAGQRVRVLYVAGAVRLVLDAVAAGTAALGEPVGVRTAEGRRLEGVAAGDAQVRIDATPGRNP